MPLATFNGLATGLDTGSLISQLMQAERRPITRLETDKAWQKSRLAAAESLNAGLVKLRDASDSLRELDGLDAKKVSLSNNEYFSATVDSDVQAGNYNIEVHAVAQAEKEYSQGIADKDAQDFGTGTITITLPDSDPIEVTITNDNNSLSGIVDAINEKDAGVTATLINDGTGTPYRMVLTADESGKDMTVSTSLAGGTINDLTMTRSQAPTQAHIVVDGLDIYSDSNTIDSAIPGMTLNLIKPDEEATKTKITATVSDDIASVTKKVGNFVKAYNDILKFIHSQSRTEDNPGGILQGDASMNSIKYKLQNMLSQRIGTGAYDSLASLGIKTELDGTLAFDSSKVSEALEDDPELVRTVFAGNDTDSTGIFDTFHNYLDNMTDSVDGFVAGRKESINRYIRKIDENIARIEARLVTKEATLVRQFTALEEIVSNLNAQGSYLSQQLDNLAQMNKQGK